MAHVSVFITGFNREQFIGECVRSVLASASDELTLTVLVIDNGSVDKTAEAAAVDPSVRVVRNERNMPVTGVFNQGIRLALDVPETDYLLQLNDDTALFPGALEKLVHAAQAHPLSLVTPLQLQFDEPHDIDTGALAGILGASDLINDALLGRPLKDAYAVKTIIGAGLLGHIDNWRNIGFFEELCWFYGVDDDYCTRAKWLGYELLLVPGAKMLHAHGRFMTSAKENPKAWIMRWRSKVQSRMLLHLKNPNRPLLINYITLTVSVAGQFIVQMSKLWLRGAFHTASIYFSMIAQYRALHEAYVRDFDVRRRVQPPAAAANPLKGEA